MNMDIIISINTALRFCIVGALYLTFITRVEAEREKLEDELLGYNCKFPAIFNFGDSNSDTGSISAAFYPRPPPNGLTFFHAPAGRVSDGRLIIDFIAKHVGLPYLSPYLDSFGTNFRHGANFATGGATIRRSNDSLFISGISPFPLDIQTVQYSNFKNRTIDLYTRGKKRSLSNNANKKNFPRLNEFSKSLFVIDIGQNDLAAGFRTMSDEKLRSQIPDMINLFAMDIQFLYQQGARTFLIHNTGPIGCLPSTIFGVQNYIRDPGFLDEHGCIKSQNDIAKEFNSRLKQRVDELRTELSLAALTYVDMYNAKYSLISNAQKLGFLENINICCGSFKNGVRSYCGNNVLTNGTVIYVEPCGDPSLHISWDGIHYTDSANHWIANHIINGHFSEPNIPLSQACYKH